MTPWGAVCHVQVHTDNDLSTKFAWARPHPLSSESTATVSWRVPPDAAPGTYRLRHFGDAKGILGSTTPFSGASGVSHASLGCQCGWCGASKVGNIGYVLPARVLSADRLNEGGHKHCALSNPTLFPEG